MNRARGFTIAELLTVFVIVGLLLGTIVAVMPLVLKIPSEAQGQVDNVDSTALALYRMQRDARQSNIKGVYTCTTTPIVACSQSPMQNVQALALLSADNAAGQFKPGQGAPAWQGFIVYWLQPNADGTSNELRRAFYAAPGITPQTSSNAQAVNAVTSVITGTDFVTVAQAVRSVSAAVDQTNSILRLTVDGGDTSGNLTSLQLRGNSYVRN